MTFDFKYSHEEIRKLVDTAIDRKAHPSNYVGFDILAGVTLCRTQYEYVANSRLVVKFFDGHQETFSLKGEQNPEHDKCHKGCCN